MGINGNFLLQSQLVELPAQLEELQMRFAEKMMKVNLAEQAVAQADAATAASFEAFA